MIQGTSEGSQFLCLFAINKKTYRLVCRAKHTPNVVFEKVIDWNIGLKDFFFSFFFFFTVTSQILLRVRVWLLPARVYLPFASFVFSDEYLRFRIVYIIFVDYDRFDVRRSVVNVPYRTAFARLNKRGGNEKERYEQINNLVKYNVRPFCYFLIKSTLLLLRGNIK